MPLLSATKPRKMSDYLPEDVLIDVLTRLPTETLVRLTSVSKSWRSLITTPKFISDHRHRNADYRLRLVRHCTDDPKTDHYSLALDGKDSFIHLKSLDSPFDSVGHSIVGSVNGVICLSHDLEYGCIDKMFLWNPSIRKLVALPKYNVTFFSDGPFMHSLGFGFDPVANDFKVVRVVHLDCFEIPPLVELYTHRTGRWRDISERGLPLLVPEISRQAYVNGAANWVALTPDHPFRNAILSFDISEEVFKEISVPESVTHEDWFVKRLVLVVFKESLCLIQQCPSDAEPHCAVWIMKEYGVSTSWSRLCRIDLSGGLKRPLGLRENGEIIFATCDGDLVSCDHQSRRITYLGVRGTFGDGYSHWHTFYTDTYTESLELLSKLESPEITVVSGQKRKKKKNKEEEKKKKKEQDEADTYADSLVMLNKLECPDNTVVGGQKKKIKKNKKAAEEKKEQEETVEALLSLSLAAASSSRCRRQLLQPSPPAPSAFAAF